MNGDLPDKRLLIFDVDGTLVKRFTSELLPGVAFFFGMLNRNPHRPFVVLASNQGGVGLRYWMEQEGWGTPNARRRLPTAAGAAKRVYHVADMVSAQAAYLCYAYQEKDGRWAPTPPCSDHPQRWRRDWRKPAPGMIYRAMEDFDVSPAETVVIGDRYSDYEAAIAAGAGFRWAREVFQGDLVVDDHEHLAHALDAWTADGYGIAERLRADNGHLIDVELVYKDTGEKRQGVSIVSALENEYGLSSRRTVWLPSTLGEVYAALRDVLGRSYETYLDAGDDLCDLCMRSDVKVSTTTEDGRTMCADCAEAYYENYEQEADEQEADEE